MVHVGLMVEVNSRKNTKPMSMGYAIFFSNEHNSHIEYEATRKDFTKKLLVILVLTSLL